MTQTLPEIETPTITDLFPYEDLEDANHRTHIVSPPENKHIYKPGMTAQDIVDTARITGQYVICLCGYEFIPKSNPEKYDICEKCVKLAQMYMQGAGE